MREHLRLQPATTTAENAPSILENGAAGASVHQPPVGDDRLRDGPPPADRD
ncbi:hypothetical protein HPB47_006458, partial [Ixodes persulcatus]